MTMTPLGGQLTPLATPTAGGPAYLLLDRFTTNQAAPLTSPRTAEPGPGMLEFIDTGNRFSISGNALVSASGGTATTLLFRSPSTYTRVNGLAATLKVVGGSLDNFRFGWSSVSPVIDAGANRAGYFIGDATSVTDNNTLIALGGTVYTTPINLYVVARSAGFLYVAGTTLVWIGNINTTANLALAYTPQNRVVTVDDVAVGVWEGGGWNTDYGIATNRVASPTAGTTTTSAADALVEFTWTAATGQTLELDVRRTDDNNRWIVRGDQAGSTIKLIERNAGVETERSSAAQTWTNGTAYRVVAIMDGTTIKTYVANVAKNTYASASFNQSATGIKVSHAGTNLVAWPRTVTLPAGY
jgi:hypothetical protein